MAYCVHDLRACASRRDREDGRFCIEHLVIAQMARIEHLEFLVAKLKRAQFGPKSEKTAVNEAQLTLCLTEQ